MSYVMAYVGSVPTERKEDYLKSCRTLGEMFREHGATRIVETWGNEVPEGKLTSFPMAVKAEPGETVVFGWQEWPDKAAQERAWEAVQQDPRAGAMQDMPIDGKRMIFAGFDTLLEL